MADLRAAVGDRRRALVPEDSAWLTAEEGLAEAVAAWGERLEPVRAAIPARVDELLGPGHALSRAARLGRVTRILAAQGLRLALADVPGAAARRTTAGPAAARRLRRAFEQLGPSYIKLGQLISSGRGLFPDVLVDEFAACRDKCPQLPGKVVRRAVAAEVGPLEEVFEHFDDQPLAAASIAQVHTARLRGGRDVVVKVRRPGIAREVEAHTRTMPAVARLVERLFPDAPIADPLAVVRLFATTILEELDFRLEAQNMVDVALDLEAAGVTDVVVPHPVPGLVTERVLVMERLHGHRFDDLAEMRAAGIDTNALLLSGLRSLVEGATVFGRFHGDLHAGNVIALADGRFGLVDFGICARLDGRERAGLQRLLVGISTRDPLAQVQGLDALGALPAGADRRRLVAQITVRRREERDRLSVDDIRDGAPRVMEIFAEHKLDLPPALVLFLKDVLYLNGSTRLLAPDLDLFSVFGALRGHFDAKYGPDRAAGRAHDDYGGPPTDEELAAVAAELDAADDGRPAEAPTLGGLARRSGPELVRSALVPMVVFVGLDQTLGLAAAILGVTAWTAGLTTVQRRRGRRSPLALVVLLFLVLRGAAGLASGSGLVYFGPDVLNNFVYGAGLLLTVAVGYPAIGLVARALYPFPRAVVGHPTFGRVFGRLTLAWAGYILLSGIAQAWVLLEVGPSAYLVAKRAMSIPAYALLLTASFRYPRRALLRDPEVARLLFTGRRRPAAVSNGSSPTRSGDPLVRSGRARRRRTRG